MKAINPILSHLLLIGMYHKHFNICDHNHVDAPPMPELAFHHLEDTMSGNLLFELPERYYEKAIHKYFHISLTEFLELPMFYIEHLSRLSDKYSEKEVILSREIENASKNDPALFKGLKTR
ncbi:MAG: hypothetical protein M0R77_01000 [Gammaproteobacteria bacterium]|nr:hypothetical protein [Acholeplasmataceae bacterium]MCK9529133.1 hypothetical protein [Gammaproteobacteria bacterium]